MGLYNNAHVNNQGGPFQIMPHVRLSVNYISCRAPTRRRNSAATPDAGRRQVRGTPGAMFFDGCSDEMNLQRGRLNIEHRTSNRRRS